MNIGPVIIKAEPSMSHKRNSMVCRAIETMIVVYVENTKLCGADLFLSQQYQQLCKDGYTYGGDARYFVCQMPFCRL